MQIVVKQGSTYELVTDPNIVVNEDGIQFPIPSLSYYSSEELEEHGIYRVESTPVDADKYVITSNTYEMVDEVLTHVPVVELRSVEDRKVIINDRINEKHQIVKNSGYFHNFGTTEAPNIQCLQTRDNEDHLNWLALKDTCRDAIEAGYGAYPCEIPIRVTSNINIPLSYSATSDVLNAVKAWGGRLLKQSWALKNINSLAVTHLDLDNVTSLVESGIIDTEHGLTGWS